MKLNNNIFIEILSQRKKYVSLVFFSESCKYLFHMYFYSSRNVKKSRCKIVVLKDHIFHFVTYFFSIFINSINMVTIAFHHSCFLIMNHQSYEYKYCFAVCKVWAIKNRTEILLDIAKPELLELSYTLNGQMIPKIRDLAFSLYLIQTT